MTTGTTLAGFQSLAADLKATAAVSKAKAGLTELKGSREAAENFESVFLSEMFKLMFENLPTDGPFGGGAGEEMFRPLLVDEYSKQLSRQGGIGLSDAVHKEMLKLQEEANA